ncbi:MAG: hypothetical protein ACI399_05190 [Candidatus Cryptobacteroides sp.]
MRNFLLIASAALLLVGCSKEPVESNTPCITFAADAQQSFTMDFHPLESMDEFVLEDGEYFEYSVGGGEWQRFTTTVSGVVFGGENGDLHLRGKSRKGTADQECITIRFADAASVRCSGDIRTLVDYEDYENADTGNAQFWYLFRDCSVLTTAPALPATTLAVSCYNSMFCGCTSLKEAPQLPATTLTEFCYNSMFSGCTSLTEAPLLPANTLTQGCYWSMFYGCTSLTEVTLYATEGFDFQHCLSNFLNGATASGVVHVVDEAAKSKFLSACTLPDNWTIETISK